ncbi:MAG: FAD-dependent oxidoreductase [Anaerolineaceae bacterium]|jgi:sarcosine oxidase subunit beta|nr:FAD-dependent oxidoreductase [Anaerolineaceae bacterium]
MNTKKTHDVIIVGAGVIGCSIAYHLTKAGFNVALIEQKHVGAGASGANFGMVQSNDVEIKHSIPMVLKGYARFNDLEEELGMDIGFRRIASLRLLSSEAQWANSRERAMILPKAGIPYEYVSPQKVLEIEPAVNPDGLFGATYASYQGQANPFLLMWGFLRKANQQGLSLLTYHELKNFIVQSGRVIGVETTRGTFYAEKIVLATAAWTRKLGILLGQNWNIHTFRASAMATERFSDLHINSIVTSADHIEAEVNGPEDAELTVMALTQTQEGNFLIAQADRPGEILDGKISHMAPRAMSTITTRFFPILRKAKIIRTWTAPTTYTDDGMPLLGPVKDLPGLILAASFRSAVVHSPVAGEIVTQLVSQGYCDLLDISPFAPERSMQEADTVYKVKTTRP